jgi:hypothetical protein
MIKMYKSSRYDYNKHPDFERPTKKERKLLNKRFRAYEKQCVRIKGDIEPMTSR